MGDRNVKDTIKGGTEIPKATPIPEFGLSKVPQIGTEIVDNVGSQIKKQIIQYNADDQKNLLHRVIESRSDINLEKLAEEVAKKLHYTSDSQVNNKDIEKTIKDIDKYRYDNLWPGGLFGPIVSNIQWWIGRIILFFFKFFNYIIFFIIILITFVFMSVIIGVIDLGLIGVHGTLDFVSGLLKGLNVIALGTLSGPKRKVDDQNKKIAKNAIELIIQIGIELISNPKPILNNLKNIIMGIKSAF
jgi:hypothetical protein